MRVNDNPNQSDLAKELRAFMARRNISQSQVAKSIDFASGTLSAWIGGKYGADAQNIETAIRQYLDLESQREEATTIQLKVLVTTAFADIVNGLNMARQKKAIVSITGEPGVGKTIAVKDYASKHAEVVLVEVDHSFTSRDLFVELCETLGLVATGSLHNLHKRVVEKLRGSGRLVIVDEAEYLPRLALDMLRRLRDFAGIPIALVGLPRLNENIQGDRNNFACLSSRMRMRRRVGSLTKTDEELIVREYLGKVSEDVLAELRKYAKANARVLVELIDICLDILRLNKGLQMSTDVVLKAAEIGGDAF